MIKRRMIENQFFENKNRSLAVRNCPLCEMPLKWEDFKEQNKSEYLDLWNNEKMAILCCKCLEILEHLTNSNNLIIKYPTDRARAWRILNNLTKLGFISEKVRDIKFKEYIENIENLRQKSILKHFLV